MCLCVCACACVCVVRVCVCVWYVLACVRVCVRVFVFPFHQHCDVQFIIVVVEKYIYTSSQVTCFVPSDMLRSKGFTVVAGNVSFMKLVTAWAILIVYLVGLVGMINRH